MIWDNKKPYWEWICTREGCAWFHRLFRNQTGDPECSMCGNPERVFVGRFASGGSAAHGGRRLNLDSGKWEWPLTHRNHASIPYAPRGSDRIGQRDKVGNIYG